MVQGTATPNKGVVIFVAGGECESNNLDDVDSLDWYLNEHVIRPGCAGILAYPAAAVGGSRGLHDGETTMLGEAWLLDGVSRDNKEKLTTLSPWIRVVTTSALSEQRLREKGIDGITRVEERADDVVGKVLELFQRQGADYVSYL